MSNEKDYKPTQKKCESCSSTFLSGRSFQRFCSNKCRRYSDNHPKPTIVGEFCVDLLPDREREIATLFTKGIPMKQMARIRDCSPTLIRRMLRQMGLLPTHSANPDHKPRGQGKDAIRNRNRTEIEIKGSEVRRQVAVCLWNLRRKKPLRTTMRENGWSDISNFIYDRKSYKRFRAAQKPRLPQSRWNSVSKSHPFESKLQSEISEFLTSNSVPFEAEARIGKTCSRVDFKLADGTHIECKVDVCAKHTDRLVGQLFRYQRRGAKSLLVIIPDDISIRTDQAEDIRALGAQIETLSRFKSRMLQHHRSVSMSA